MCLSWYSFWLDHTTSTVGNGSFKPELQMTQVARNKCRTQKAGSVWCIVLRELAIILIKHLLCCKCFGILGLAFCLQENIIPIALSYVWKADKHLDFFLLQNIKVHQFAVRIHSVLWFVLMEVSVLQSVKRGLLKLTFIKALTREGTLNFSSLSPSVTLEWLKQLVRRYYHKVVGDNMLSRTALQQIPHSFHVKQHKQALKMRSRIMN